MLFNAIFLGILLGGWAICAYAPWVALSVLTRGRAGVQYLPLCLLAGIVAAVAVPLMGADGIGGLWASFGAAMAAPTLLLILRHYTIGAVRREQSAGARATTEQPK